LVLADAASTYRSLAFTITKAIIMKYLWILDNGHGVNTAGKRSPKLPDGRQLLEYEYNRSIVNYLATLLHAAGINYHILVPELDDIPLAERVTRANNLPGNAKRLISIHGNSAVDELIWHPASGIETFCFPGSEKGAALAEIIQKHLIATTHCKNRGVKTDKFYILKHTNMTSVLTENGFYSNQAECTKMFDATWREKIALAHFNAIAEIEQSM
jgi:N-acetylmuramoyl-L-alanine amidase